MRPQERADLLADYRRLVLDELPARARREHWVVVADHCFGRIVLDAAVGGGPWYDVLGAAPAGRGPAFTRLDDDQLRRAVAVARSVEAGGDERLRELDAASLAARGKRPRRPRRRAGG